MKKGMAQRELAGTIDLPKVTIGSFESKKHIPQLDLLIKVANALGCKIGIIIS